MARDPTAVMLTEASSWLHYFEGNKSPHEASKHSFTGLVRPNEHVKSSNLEVRVVEIDIFSPVMIGDDTI